MFTCEIRVRDFGAAICRLLRQQFQSSLLYITHCLLTGAPRSFEAESGFQNSTAANDKNELSMFDSRERRIPTGMIPRKTQVVTLFNKTDIIGVETYSFKKFVLACKADGKCFVSCAERLGCGSELRDCATSVAGTS